MKAFFMCAAQCRTNSCGLKFDFKARRKRPGKCLAVSMAMLWSRFWQTSKRFEEPLAMFRAWRPQECVVVICTWCAREVFNRRLSSRTSPLPKTRHRMGSVEAFAHSMMAVVFPAPATASTANDDPFRKRSTMSCCWSESGASFTVCSSIRHVYRDGTRTADVLHGRYGVWQDLRDPEA